ncbi:MAG: hypothetical protein KC503_28265 [Myxococcales bacterium]|nr:hypothetical protein [Myxococcales bacterium]
MAVLVFPGAAALEACLRGELVPQEIQRAPARFREGDDGEIVVEVSGIDRKRRAELKKLGVGSARALGRTPDVNEVSCWAEILRPVFVGDEALDSAVALFWLERQEDLVALAGELLRLGCDRQELCALPDELIAQGGPAALVRAVDPPFYTLVRALDRPGGLRAFVPAPAGQEQIFVEAGYRHPLVEHVQRGSAPLLLITAEGHFVPLEELSFQGLYQLIDVAPPRGDARHAPLPPPPRVQVTLTLVPRAREALPTLWVIRERAIESVERLIERLPEAELSKLLFAATSSAGGDSGEPTVLLRVRPGRGSPPVLDLPGEAFAPWLEIDNLYLPSDAILEPPLRRETLRNLLAERSDEVCWLTPLDAEPSAGGNGAGNGAAATAAAGVRPPERARPFQLERAPESAFAPLSHWVQYVVHSSAEALEPWVRSSTFDFEAFESTGLEWSDSPPQEEREPRSTRKRRRRRDDIDDEPSGERASEALPDYEIEDDEIDDEPEPMLEAPPPVVVEEGAEAQLLSQLEARYLELEAPADDPERTRLWAEMGELNARLERERQSRLCFARAVWELDGDAANTVVARWAASMGVEGDDVAASIGDGADAEAGLVVLGVLGPALAQADGALLQRVQLWLDEKDGSLDVRTIWLARVALSRAVGGDRLQLLRARDRIVARLSRGLSLARDVPTFMRFAGSSGGSEGAAHRQLVRRLTAFLDRFRKTRRSVPFNAGADARTDAYGLLLFAYGFARLGEAEHARALREEALGAIDTSDPIHAIAAPAYAVRVDHALEGLPLETKLPDEIEARLNELPKFKRYTIDRLRHASQVLEPQERLQIYTGFLGDADDPRGAEFASLRGLGDAAQLRVAVDEVLAMAEGFADEPQERARLLDGVMDFFPLLAEAEAVPRIERVAAALEGIEAPRRAELLDEALMLAALFGRAALVEALATRLQVLFAELGEAHIEVLGRLLGGVLRSLRRAGLGERAAELLTAAESAVQGDEGPALQARLSLGTALADLGRYDEARAIAGVARKRLADVVGANKGPPLLETLNLARGLAELYACLPLDEALGGLEALSEHLGSVSDIYSSNTHFCVSVLEFVESLVLGYASDQLSLGEVGRRLLDEDEYLVRRRVHRDTRL